MAAEWVERRLGDVVGLQRGFDLPHAQRRPGTVKVLSAGLEAGWHDEPAVSGPGFAIGRATNLGRPVWSDTDYWPLNTTLFAKDFKGNHPRFLFHLFEWLDLTGFDSGSVQPMLNRNNIAGLPVLIPDLSTQTAIAEVLGSLDDKIAANERVVELAERWMLMTIVRESPTLPLVPLSELALLRRGTVQPSEGEVAHFSLPAFDNGRLPVKELGSGIKSAKQMLRGPAVLLSKLNPRIPRVWDLPTLPDDLPELSPS